MLQFILFGVRSINIYNFLPSTRHFWRRYPKGIDNPFNTSGCEDLLSVCRGCLRCVAWFSYWFDNLCFISEGNTYHRCAASSLPLWRNTDVASSDITRLVKFNPSIPHVPNYLAPVVCECRVYHTRSSRGASKP